MDACSTQDQNLTKDSPSSKVLFADVMDEYRKMVQEYYRSIREMPPVREEQMNAMLAEESRAHANDFRVFSGLNELYNYVQQNKEAIADELNSSELCLNQGLPEKFNKLLATMEVMPETNGSLEYNYNSKSRLMSNSRFY
jgi:plexin A